jgi:hypothetical protein
MKSPVAAARRGAAATSACTGGSGLSEVIRGAAPKARESIKWAQPVCRVEARS